jgi:hypothetical protein
MLRLFWVSIERGKRREAQMRTAEKIETLHEMKQTVEAAIASVNVSRKQTEQSETDSYWMALKMENNRQSFQLEDIQIAAAMSHKLSNLIEHYDKMLKLGDGILLELEDIENQVQSDKNSLDDAYEEVKIVSMYAKMYLFLKEGEDCMEAEHSIQSDAATLKKRLEGRGGLDKWYKNLKNRFKGVFA